MLAIKNYMEDLVSNTIKKIVKPTDCCLCERCHMDVMAMALNNLPSKYIVTDKGELFTKISILEQQFEVDVVSAVMKAAMTVAENPRHCLNKPPSTQED